MGLTGSGAAQLRSLAKRLDALGQKGGPVEQRMIREAGRAVRQVQAQSISAGESPYGDRWPLNRNGEQAFARSKRIRGAFGVQEALGKVRIYGRIDWLEAHQTGHVFPPRSQSQRFARIRGRFVSFARARRRKRGVSYGQFSASYRRRVLPQRQLLPTVRQGMPDTWARRINAITTDAMRRALGAKP